MASTTVKAVPTAASALFIALELLFLIEHAFLPISAFTLPSESTARVSVIIPSPSLTSPHRTIQQSALFSTDDNTNLGVIDLTEEEDDDGSSSPTNTAPPQQQMAPFLSQGEISTDPNLLSPDFNDAKQTRVIIYIILTLLPVLFLVPLMIGSRDLIPLDAFPPVELN
jgi:hypothetical protein